MKRLTILIALGLLWLPLAARASNCSGYTYTLTNGQLADANQVMSNFNNVLNCANNNLISAATVAATYAPLVSPVMTGTPTAPTASPGVNTTQIGTTAYVTAAIAAQAATDASNYAPKASPALTGTPTAPTGTPGDGSTQIATDAFVGAAITAAAPSAATTSTAGIAALATGALVVTGTDTTHAVTPASLTSAQSLAANGYDKLPGGLIVEWGTSGTVSGSGGTLGVTLPLACASALYSVVLTTAGAGAHFYAYPYGFSTSGFSINNEDVGSVAFYWQAICK